VPAAPGSGSSDPLTGQHPLRIDLPFPRSAHRSLLDTLQAGGRRFESARLHQTQVGGRLAGSQQRQIGDEQAQRVDVRTSPEMDR
jgi:hypothetical protein